MVRALFVILESFSLHNIFVFVGSFISIFFHSLSFSSFGLFLCVLRVLRIVTLEKSAAFSGRNDRVNVWRHLPVEAMHGIHDKCGGKLSMHVLQKFSSLFSIYFSLFEIYLINN